MRTGSHAVRILRTVLAAGGLVFVFLDLAFRSQSGSLANYGGFDWARRVMTPGDLVLNLFLLGGAILMVIGWRLLRKCIPANLADAHGWEAAVERWCALNGSVCIAVVSVFLYSGYLLAYQRVVRPGFGGSILRVSPGFPPVSLVVIHSLLLFVFTLTGASLFLLIFRDIFGKGSGPDSDRDAHRSGSSEFPRAAVDISPSGLAVLLPVIAGAAVLLAATDLTIWRFGRDTGGPVGHFLHPVLKHLPLSISLAAIAAWLILRKLGGRIAGASMRGRAVLERWVLIVTCAYATSIYLSGLWIQILSVRRTLEHKRFSSTLPYTDVVYPSNSAMVTQLAVPAVLGLTAICLFIIVFRALRTHGASRSISV